MEVFPVALSSRTAWIQAGSRAGQLHTVGDLEREFSVWTMLGTEPNLPGILVPEPSAVELTFYWHLVDGLLNRKRR